MITLINSGGVAMTNSILVASETAGEAVIFDAPDHTVEPLLEEVAKRGWTLKGLWVTHGHFDHFADHAVVRRRYPSSRCLIHELDEEKARHPAAQTGIFGLDLEIPSLIPDDYVSDGQALSIGEIEVTVLHTPGHSPGHVAYYFPRESLLIGGDLIIGGSVGRTDLPDSRHEQLEASVRRVMALPAETRLIGGHGPPTTLAEERKSNFFVRSILGAE